VTRLRNLVRPEAEFDGIRFALAVELDRVTDRGRNAASPAYPEGGLVGALADELGASVETLLEWGAAAERGEA